MIWMQDVVVGLLVLASTAYAAWTLMPAGWRRSLAGRMLTLAPWPPRLAERLGRASAAASGCGCDGCDHAPANANARAKAKASANSPTGPANPTATANRPAVDIQPITFHPRAPSRH